MTGIQFALILGGLPLLTLAVLISFGRCLNSRVPSTVEWPVDVYVRERRRWVRARSTAVQQGRVPIEPPNERTQESRSDL